MNTLSLHTFHSLNTTDVLIRFLDIVDTALATLCRRLPGNVARDDLASVGKLALITALGQRREQADRRENHDNEADIRAWCYVRVRGAMLDELRRLDPLTRRQRDRVSAIARARLVLVEKLGREPGPGELAAALHLSVSELVAAQTAVADAAAAASVSAAVNTGDIEWDALTDTATPSPADAVELTDLHASLRAALDRLPANQALALRRYYLEDATLDDIAAELGVSRERARQVRESGEKKLRADFVVLSLWQTFISRNVSPAA